MVGGVLLCPVFERQEASQSAQNSSFGITRFSSISQEGKLILMQSKIISLQSSKLLCVCVILAYCVNSIKSGSPRHAMEEWSIPVNCND